MAPPAPALRDTEKELGRLASPVDHCAGVQSPGGEARHEPKIEERLPHRSVRIHRNGSRTPRRTNLHDAGLNAWEAAT